MRKFILLFVIASFASINLMAQADTLVINLKNSQVEKIALSQIQKIRFENITSVDEQNLPAKALDLIGNSPNPFNDKTNIEFEIKTSGNVMVLINDVNGDLVEILECANCPAGKNSITWNCLDAQKKRVNSGLYHYEIRFNDQVQTKNMILIR